VSTLETVVLASLVVGIPAFVFLVWPAVPVAYQRYVAWLKAKAAGK